MARQLQLDDTLSDLRVEDGRLVICDGTDSIEQSCVTRIRFFKGEFFADLEEGMPYIEYILVKAPDLDLITTLYRSVLSSTPGVAAVDTVDLDYDSAARTLDVSAKLSTDDNTLITLSRVEVTL